MVSQSIRRKKQKRDALRAARNRADKSQFQLNEEGRKVQETRNKIFANIDERLKMNPQPMQMIAAIVREHEDALTFGRCP